MIKSQVYVLYGISWTATNRCSWTPVLFDTYDEARGYLMDELRDYLECCGCLAKDRETVLPNRNVNSITVNGVDITDPIFGKFRVAELLDTQVETVSVTQEFSGIEWHLRRFPVYTHADNVEGSVGGFSLDQ